MKSGSMKSTLAARPRAGRRDRVLASRLGLWRIIGLTVPLALLQALAAEITFSSLLDEMADPDALARFPHPEYRQLQASSYNRKSVARDQPDRSVEGWFADGDGGGFVREEAVRGRREWVILDHAGPGCLTKFWTPFFHHDFNNRVGPRLRIYLDGAEEPAIDARFIELLTRNDWQPSAYGLRPAPQNTWAVPAPFADFTARAGNLYLPIPFARGCKVTLDDRPFYHIVNYRAYPAGTKVCTFSLEQYEAAKAQIDRVGQQLLDPPEAAGSDVAAREDRLVPGRALRLALPRGPAALRQFEVRLDPAAVASHPGLLRSIVLRFTFDDDETVWCPLGDFFGSPNALNPFQTQARSVTAGGRLTCRWTMPYRRRAQLMVENAGAVPVGLLLSARTRPWRWDRSSMHFHARWRADDVLPGQPFVDWNFIDVRGQGVLVGDQWTVLNLTRGWWGEGDEKIYVDEAYENRKFPDHFGTGTEDYYGWAGGVNPTREDKFDHPFVANVCVGSTGEDNTRGFNVCTRSRCLDAVPFRQRLVFDMEASPGVDQRQPWDLLGYSAVTFWYALPGAASNRPADPAGAARPVMSLEALTAQSKALREGH